MDAAEGAVQLRCVRTKRVGGSTSGKLDPPNKGTDVACNENTLAPAAERKGTGVRSIQTSVWRRGCSTTCTTSRGGGAAAEACVRGTTTGDGSTPRDMYCHRGASCAAVLGEEAAGAANSQIK